MAGLTTARPVRGPLDGGILAPRPTGVAAAQLGLWAAMVWHMTAQHSDRFAALGVIGACLGIAGAAAVGVRRGSTVWNHALADALFMAAAVTVGVVLGGAAGHGSHRHLSALDMRVPALCVLAVTWLLVHVLAHPGRRRARRFATALPMLAMFAWMIAAC